MKMYLKVETNDEESIEETIALLETFIGKRSVTKKPIETKPKTKPVKKVTPREDMTPEEIAASLQVVGQFSDGDKKPALTPVETKILNGGLKPTPTKDEVKAALKAYSAKYGQAARNALLERHGAKEDGVVHPKNLNKGKWAVVIEECNNEL